MHSYQKSLRGFTLVEMLVAVTIFAVLGTLTVVFYTRFLTQNNVASIQDQLFSQLRKAHVYSTTSRKSAISGWGVHYDGTNHKTIMFLGPSYTGRTAAFDETFTFAGSITMSGFPATNDITFARVTGLPTPSTTTTIIISGPNNISKQVIINGQGVATR
jgi:prepilin-type N-terminal cleavage/methylation domain-containing protein